MRKFSWILGFFLLLSIVAVIAEPKVYVDIHGDKCNPLQVQSGKKANVLCFTTTDCPIANGYSQRFNQLKQEFSKQGFDFYLVHVDWDTTVDSARKHHQDYGLELKTLLDPKHKLVQHTGVSTTPEVAVLLPDGKVAYRGRIDNWYEGFGKKRNVITKTELSDALYAIGQNKAIPVKVTTAIGCSIPELPK